MGFLSKIGSGIGDVFSGISKGAGSLLGLPSSKDESGALTSTGNIFSTIGGVSGGLGNVLGPMAGLADAFTDKPSPSDMGEDYGKAQRAFMDAAYPGTNPWERLGTGQGGATSSVAEKGQDLQDRLNRRTLNTQREIANKQALASVAPAIIAQHPKSASAILGMITDGTTPPGSIGEESPIGERDAAIRRDLADTEMFFKRAKITNEQFANATNRFIYQLQSDRFDYEQAVKEVDVVFKNRELAHDYVRTMATAAESMGSNPWKTFMSWYQDAMGKVGVDTMFDRLSSAVGKAGEKDMPIPPPDRVKSPKRP